MVVVIVSYMTVTELDDLAVQLFTTAELEKFGYSSISASEKEVYLERVSALFSSLLWLGEKTVYNSPECFPRLIYGEEVLFGDSLKKGFCGLFMGELEADKSSRINSALMGISSISTAGVSESYNTSISVEGLKKGLKGYQIAGFYLNQYLYSPLC